MEREAARMQQGLDELDEHIDDAAKKARENRERGGLPADESLEAAAGDAADRSTSSDDPASAVGDPTDADADS